MQDYKEPCILLYILRCVDDSYYTGSTTDLARRMSEYDAGVDTKAYTYSCRPVKLTWSEEFSTRDEAFLCERQIKGWSRRKKAALIRNDWEEIQRIVREKKPNS